MTCFWPGPLSGLRLWGRGADDALSASPSRLSDLVLDLALPGIGNRVVIRFAGDERSDEGETDGVHRRPRRGVDRHGLGEDPVQTQVSEAVADQLSRSLARVPVAPVFAHQPITQVCPPATFG